MRESEKERERKGRQKSKETLDLCHYSRAKVLDLLQLNIFLLLFDLVKKMSDMCIICVCVCVLACLRVVWKLKLETKI